MRAAEQRILEAENAFRRFQSFRGRVDENLAKPGPERETEVVGWICAASTELIDVAANKLRLTLETLTTPPTAAMAQLVNLRHLTAQMAENAGRERGFLGGAIAAHEKLTADDIGRIADFRGRVVLAWETISPVSQRADVSAKVANAIAGVEKDYFVPMASFATKCGRAG